MYKNRSTEMVVLSFPLSTAVVILVPAFNGIQSPSRQMEENQASVSSRVISHKECLKHNDSASTSSIVPSGLQVGERWVGFVDKEENVFLRVGKIKDTCREKFCVPRTSFSWRSFMSACPQVTIRIPFGGFS